MRLIGGQSLVPAQAPARAAEPVAAADLTDRRQAETGRRWADRRPVETPMPDAILPRAVFLTQALAQTGAPAAPAIARRAYALPGRTETPATSLLV